MKSTKKARKQLKSSVHKLLIALLFIGVLCAIGFIGYNTLRVEKFDITGNVATTTDQITTALGVEPGTSMFDLDYEAMREGLSKLPYIDLASVEYKLPSTIEVVVTERKKEAVVHYMNQYIYVDRKGYVLAVEDSALPEPYLRIKGLSVTTYSLANVLGVLDELQLSVMENVIAALEAKGLLETYSALDLSNPVNIKLTYEDLTIILGQPESLEEKLDQVMFVQKELAQMGKTKGVIRCTSGGQPTFTEEILELPQEEEAPTEEDDWVTPETTQPPESPDAPEQPTV